MKCFLILSWLLSHNYSHNESIGIVSNLFIESRCDPNASNSYQIGLAQWQGKRKKDLINFAKFFALPSNDLYLQLNFLDQEWKEIKSSQLTRSGRRPRPTLTLNSYSFSFSLSPTYHLINFCKKFEKPKSPCSHRKLWKIK